MNDVKLTSEEFKGDVEMTSLFLNLNLVRWGHRDTP